MTFGVLNGNLNLPTYLCYSIDGSDSSGRCDIIDISESRDSSDNKKLPINFLH